ncbi:MAG TPA: DsbC family protein [Woeseiaceae bacterium]|nr:DsbC family protein [Woeseiaceae bacterium]
MNTHSRTALLSLQALLLISPQGALRADDAAHTIASAMPGTPIKSTLPTVIEGLYEVVAGDNVLYVDTTGRYLVIGSIYDLKEDKDLSASRRAQVSQASAEPGLEQQRIRLDAVPLEAAITVGTGDRSLTVITDPGCAWCRRLWLESLNSLSGVRVHHLLLSRTPESLGILCAKDPGAALGRAFEVSATTAKTPVPSARCQSEAQAKIARVARFAERIGAVGTPVLIRDDGVIHAGFLGRDALMDWLGGDTDAS